MAEKRSTGPNARPKDETIAQSGEGLPDDSGKVPQDAREADEAAARRSLERLGQAGEKESAQSKAKGQSGSEAGDRSYQQRSAGEGARAPKVPKKTNR